MRISYIMIGGMFVLFLFFAIYGIIAFDLSIQEIKKLLNSRNEGFTFIMMQDLDQKIESRLNVLRDLTTIPEVRDALIESNDKFAKLQSINDLYQNYTQPNSLQATAPFMSAVVDSDLTDELRNTIQFYKDEYNFDVFKELFITNSYGANVALGSGFSDFTQTDAVWWQKAKEKGIYYEGLQYHDDYQTYALGVAYRITDEQNNFIGVMHVLVSTDDLFSDFINEAELVNNQYRNVILLDEYGRIIYSKGIQDFENASPVPYYETIKEGKDVGNFELADSVDNIRLISYAKSTGYKSFEGFDWTVVVDQDTSNIVDEFVDLRNSILLISIIGMLISVIVAIIISKLVSNPLEQISKMAKSLSTGDFTIRTKPSKITEIHTIGESFNQMAESLDKLVDTEKRLAEANARVKNERLTAIGELAANMSHDLKNPLATIRSTAEIIKRSKQETNPELDNALARMNRAIDRISHQVEDVLNFVRITPVNLSTIDINSLLKSAIDSIEIPNNIQIILPEKSSKITCDAQKIEIVFINLILNSIQAIGNNPGKIVIRIKEEHDHIVIEFEDSGDGIPESLLPKIFDPLVTTKEKGTGLGLSSCKNIIEQHGGTISAKNNPTLFTIRLPLVPK